jgi:hypothetical protein
MARKAKPSDLWLVLDRIDTDIAQLEALKARLLAVHADIQAKAATSTPGAAPRKSHKKKPADAPLPGI